MTVGNCKLHHCGRSSNVTALEFQTSLESNGTLKVPPEVASQLQNVSSFRVLLLLPTPHETAEEEDAAWDKLTEQEFFKGYTNSDSVYDDV
jgi:hypothetical protein